MTKQSPGSIQAVENKLKLGIIVTASILAVELVGGFLSNSLALLSDAGHLFTDVLALSISLYGVRQVSRPPSSHMTFGYHRVGVLIAIVNAIGIFIIAGIILYEAYSRLMQPTEVRSLLMLVVATIGLGANVLVAFWLRTEQRTNLNIRSAFWHVFGDALASVGVIIGALIILLTGWFWVDPAISGLISVIIIIAGVQILRQGIRVLLEAAPPGVDAMEIIHALKQMPGIRDVHDVHVWSISPELHAMSCHVLIDDLPTSQATDIRQRVEHAMRQQFQIEHTTVQMECQQCDAGDIFCTLTFGAKDKQETNSH